jgi:hypothetical protein
MFRMESHLAFVPGRTRDPPVDPPTWMGQEIPSEKGGKQKLVSFLCAGVPPPGPTPTLNLLYTAAPPWVSTTSPCRLFPGAVREIAESCLKPL